MNITNPTNIIRPAHVGQMFFDMVSEVMYQARGRTAADWHFVPPIDLPGSFVKIYDFFIGPAYYKNAVLENPADYIEHLKDSEAVRDTMALDGVRVLQAFAWRTANGVEVLQTRIKFDRVSKLSMFIGFCSDAKAHALPDGDGFAFEDGGLCFGTEMSSVQQGATVLLRLEAADGGITSFVNDRKFATLPRSPSNDSPVIALFARDPGERKIAPGYERALKRNLT